MKYFKMSLLAIAVTASSFSHATVTDTSYEDIADSAHWQSANGQQALLISTLEEDGIAVFNAQGKQIQHIQSNEVAGVDVRYGMTASNGDKIDIAAVALVDEAAFAFYQIDAKSDTPLRKIGEFSATIKAEGVCLAKNLTTGDIYINGFSDEGDWVQFKLNYDGQKISSALESKGEALPVRTTQVGGKLSACVVDDESATLYLAEQNVGIWEYGSDPENVKDRTLLDVAQPIGHLSEVESIDIAYQKEGEGLIIVADEQQGFLLYDRNSKAFINQFDVDGVEEAKLVTVSDTGLWIGNTELDEPIYQTLSFKELSRLGLANTDGKRSDQWINNAHLKTSDLKLVKAAGETQQVDKSGDAADDPALWYNADKPSESLIIATNKKGGLLAYDLHGKEVQYIKGNEVNNVDIRQNIKGEDGHLYDIAAASNRELNTIALYAISKDTNTDKPMRVLDVVGQHRHAKAPELASGVEKIYGLCMSQSPDGVPYVFINSKKGEIEQWKISINEAKATGTLVRTLQVDSQPEGCVVDDKTQTLYVGEEDVAIWAFDADEKGSTEATLFAKVDGDHLVDDIEGLTIYQTETQNLLLASSQGNNTYAVFDLDNKGAFVSNFAIIGDDSKGVDGASDTDGIHAAAFNLGEAYPQGVFIAQDWYNLSDKYQPLNQNFKIVDWREIQTILK